MQLPGAAARPGENPCQYTCFQRLLSKPVLSSYRPIHSNAFELSSGLICLFPRASAYEINRFGRGRPLHFRAFSHPLGAARRAWRFVPARFRVPATQRHCAQPR